MPVTKATQYGQINISAEAITKVVADAALECYGVVGLASKNALRDNIIVLLKMDNLAKGVVVAKERSGYAIDIYLVIAYGIKITEVLSEVQKKVRYVLERTFAVKFKKINVYAQSLERVDD